MKKAFLIAVSVIIVGFLQAQTPRLVVPVGHTDEIASVSFSPDGKHVLTGSRDKTAKLWDMSGREIATFAGHSNTISAVAFSPDGKFILTGSEDHTAGLWEISGSRIHALRGHGSAVKAVAFSPDGQFLLTGSDDGTAKLWDFSGKEIKTFSDHPSGVLAVAFSADGKYILTGSGKSPTKSDQTTRFGIARLFDRESGLEIRVFSGHSDPVTVVAFSADGKYVVTGSLDASAKLYELETGREIRTFKSRAGIKAVSISPGGKYLLAASQETAQCWDLQSGNPVRSWEAHPDAVISSIAFSPFDPDEQAGNNYILAGGERSAELLDWTGRTIRAYAGHSTAATALAFFAADGQKTLLMGCADGSAKRWNLAETGIQTLAEHDEAVVIAAFSVDGNSVLTAAADNTVKQWDENGRVAHSFAGTLEYPPAIALSPPGPGDPAGGKYILYGTRENGVEVWSRQPRKKIRIINRPFDQGRMFEARVDWEQLVSALAFSPADGGKSILIGDSQGNIEIRERDTGGIIKSIKGGAEADVGKDYFSTDAWQTMTFEEYVEAELKKLEGHTGVINAVAYSPDGKFFLSASADRTAKLWDAQYRLLHTFSHSAPVITTAFSPACPDDPAGGKFILTGSADNTVKLWHRASGELVHTFEGHTATASAFSSDGKFVFTGSLDNTTKLWDIQGGQELATLISIGATDWVITNPSGLFDASPGAMKLLHYVVGLDVIDLEQLKERYYEPGLLQRTLGYASGGLRPVDELNYVALYPAVTKAVIEGDRLQVQLEERSGGIGKVVLLLDETITVEANANPAFQTTFELDLSRFARHFVADSINRLSLRAYNREGWLKGEHYRLEYRPTGVQGKGNESGMIPLGARRDAKLESIDLYAVIIGTSNYSGSHLNLKYPDQDAIAFAEALGATGAKLFGQNIEITLLTTSADPFPRKAEIARALKEIAGKADPNDILLVYLSGHGITYPPNSEKGRFYYLTTDIKSDKLDDPTILNTLAVSQDTLQDWIRQVPARKRLLILDACNSGQVVESLMTGEKALNSDQRRALEIIYDRSGMFVLAGSAADKSSFEATSYGHGLLTYSLLNNMPQVAAANKSLVDVGQLFNNALKEVPLLAKDIDRVQKPEMIGSGSFPIGIIDGETPYAIPKPLPVFLRCSFTQAKKFKDLQFFSKAADEYLRRLSSIRGAGIAFWDVEEFSGDHYSIVGQYEVDGEAIDGLAILYRKDQQLAELPFSGAVDALNEIAENIVSQAIEFVHGK